MAVLIDRLTFIINPLSLLINQLPLLIEITACGGVCRYWLGRGGAREASSKDRQQEV